VQYRLLHEDGGQRTFAVVLASGDAVMKSLESFADREHLGAAQITGIGAFSDVTLQYFDWETKKYQSIDVDEQVEVASLIGDVATAPDGTPALHIHLVVGKRDGSAMAGHLGEGHVRPTLELIIEESPAHLCKVKDPETGLALIQPQATR
jgi:predicted DNA-binding protein with PD1-like motif